MSGRGKARDEVSAEVVDRRGSEKQRRDDQVRRSQYLRWCAANSQPPEPPERPQPDYPGADQVLVRFLFAHHHTVVGEEDAWSWSHATTFARIVADEQRRNGHPDPRGRRVRLFLKTLRAEIGTLKDVRTDALTQAQVNVAAERAGASLHPLSPLAVRLRGVVAAAEALGVDPTSTGGGVQRLPWSAFDVRPDAVVITDGSGEYRLDAVRQPQFYAALTAALDLPTAAATDRPLMPRVEDRTQRANRRTPPAVSADLQPLFQAWARGFPVEAGKVDGRLRPAAELRAQIAATWDGDRPEDRMWWLENLDPWLGQRRRDLAYELCGVVNGRRHIELERLTVGKLQLTGTGGYGYQVIDEKSSDAAARQGEARPNVLARYLDHLADDPAACQPSCPACRMRDHLEMRRRSGAGDDDPLFIGRRGEALRGNGGRHAIRRLAHTVQDLDAAEDGTERNYGTRTMRVTAATLAYNEAKMEPQEIADEVTGHRSAEMAMRYVRINDPAANHDLVLPLDGCERTPTRRNAATAAG
ncbi:MULTISPECIES: hypothetical protein [unclassified Modestobacter]|uniref:hypothetical protein n=1 Tax=unclassified Modestobacter TaxID=2643866 RepID=UPI0022AB27FA|nr:MULTISPECIES: hypothetical protein [unclassified Modestobacter]MCZ2826018.1 hypothetical protein [Modestobacter sp. VKM Ac-2981]MCZ2852917.1 hypothetical protein [Modestobacter sp. VKM Ac-2982]